MVNSMEDFKPLDLAQYLPYALGRAIVDVAFYSRTATHFDTAGLMDDLDNLSEKLFKSKEDDIVLHSGIISGAKVIMESNRRDSFRAFILHLGDTSSADFLQSLYDFLQQASYGRVKYDLFQVLEEKAIAVGTGLKEAKDEIEPLTEVVL